MSSELDVQYATVGSIELAYTTAGDRTAPPLLLISGLGSQLIGWEDDFCTQLVEHGLYVIRFDNRDVGLSTHLGADAAYTLADLAADTAELIDVLGLGSAHVVGVSMGGMIAQILAIDHPARVRSLTSIMSTTGDPAVGEASDAAQAMLLAPPVYARDAVMDAAVAAARLVDSPAYPRADDEVRDRAARAFDRAFFPEGVGRQLLACVATPDRTELLRQLAVPSLVIHGADDPLIGVSGGRATAAAIPDAELMVIEGVGHDLPKPLWPALVDRIVGLVARVEKHAGAPFPHGGGSGSGPRTSAFADNSARSRSQ